MLKGRTPGDEYERAYAAAVALARGLTRGEGAHVAEEIAQDAMVAAFDPARSPWKQDKPLEVHVLNVARGLCGNRRKGQKVRDNPKNAAAVEEKGQRSALPADARVRVAERIAREDARAQVMLGRLTGLPRDVLLLILDGIVDPEKQAAILGKDVKQIYKARARIIELARELREQGDVEPPSSSDPAPVAGDDDGDDEGDRGDGDAS